MMNNNKILTVSYGTFSCTLEGFEDSFGTMKIIAEYFRDLAADDRYFGAEPPQPDAQMLARIAQTEVDRQVSAREQDGKIVLSALDSDVAPAVAAGAAATGLAAITAAQAEADEKVETEEVAEGVTLDAVSAPIEDAQEIVIEEVAAVKVDAVTTEDVAETLEEDSPATETLKIEEVVATEEEVVASGVAEATEEQPSADVASEEDENDIVPGQTDADVSAFFASEPVEAAAETVEAPEADATAPDSIAAKLQRIRAVVAQHEDSEEEEDTYLEDEHADITKTTESAEDENDSAAQSEGEEDIAAAFADAESNEDEAADVIAEARAELEEALEMDEAADASSSEENEVDAILNRMDAETSTEEVATEEPVADAVVEETVEESVNTLFETEEATAEAVKEEAAVEAKAEVPVTATRALRKSRFIAVEPKVEEKADSRRTRVIKVKRADLEDAIDKGDLEEYEGKDSAAKSKAHPGLDDLAPTKSTETALSKDDQDDLARELNALEKDIASDDADQKVAAAKSENPNATRRIVNSRGLLPEIDKERGGAMSRLLAETDHQMDEPESATRRDAFAHLRAAVAAKKADDSMSKDASGTSGDDAYREDLAEAVKPRRPLSGSPQTDRPEDSRSAPLKLVAEQRIDGADEGETDAANPVKPRRVATKAEAVEATADGDSFAAFASEQGATTLPQLLEAAAAYMSFVEGREQFSRPQLMTKVRQAEGQDGFSREDGLRSFGQLLRAGKIEKLKGGRFTVSDDIGYRPDQRAAG